MTYFKKNVGTTDQVIRFLIGAGLIAMYFMAETQVMQWTGLVLGTVLLLTVVFSYCPIYALFGLSSRRHAGKGKRGGGESSMAKVSSFEDKAEAEKARKAAMKSKSEEEKKKEKDAA